MSQSDRDSKLNFLSCVRARPPQRLPRSCSSTGRALDWHTPRVRAWGFIAWPGPNDGSGPDTWLSHFRSFSGYFTMLQASWFWQIATALYGA